MNRHQRKKESMNHFIQIEHKKWPADTVEEIDLAAEELARRGIECKPVFVGNGPGCSSETGRFVYASPYHLYLERRAGKGDN